MDFYTNNSEKNYYISTKDIRCQNQYEDVDIQTGKTKEKTKSMKSKYIIFMISLILLMKIIIDTSLTANATSYTPQRTNFSDSIGISITALGFDDHKGMMSTLKNNYIYCIQRGYPFRSKVSELQMVDSTISNGVVSGSGTIASNIRLLLRQQFTDKTGATSTKYFRCWGQATYNGDHTNAYQTGTNGAPTSSAWTEDFTEFREDDEDSQYNSRYQGSSDVSFWIIYLTLTGHEGSLEPFKTEMRQIDYSAAGLNMSQVYAFAMTQYYFIFVKK